jgi:hypothetical protein
LKVRRPEVRKAGKPGGWKAGRLGGWEVKEKAVIK